MTIYDFMVKDWRGEDVAMSDFEGKVLLIVVTATDSGYTDQYRALQFLYQKYKDQGFLVLDFPCNQFANQAPGSDLEIAHFCQARYQTTFPRFQKVKVNGTNASLLFAWLKNEKPGWLGGLITWNFTKFLVDRDGIVTDRFAPRVYPLDIENDIQLLL